MRRLLGLTTIAVLLVGGAVACGDDKEEGGSDTTAKSSEDSGSSSGSGNKQVDEFCDAVDEYSAEMEKALEDPMNADTAALQAKATELTQQAADLTATLIDEPELAQDVTDCSEKLTQAATGG
jgi:maltose-binding protein MalE